MVKWIIEFLSKALVFTKTETRGTLFLIFVIFIALLLSNYRIFILKERSELFQDSSALKWIKEVHLSIEARKIKEDQPRERVNYKTKFFKKNPMDRSYKNIKFMPKRVNTPIVVHDLNQASADELQIVRGIGPTYSQRIIKYRNLLGGYSNIEQLKEVYEIQNEVIEELVKHFKIESPVSKLEINSDSIKKLIRHPYINYDLAKVIINYRKIHGDIETAEDIKKIKAIDERTFLKLKPYLE